MYKISKQKKIELENRLKFLETVQKKEVQKFLSDNKLTDSWHQAASVESHRNAFEKEVNDLRTLLKSTEVIIKSEIDKSKVGVGVTVVLGNSEKTLRWKIVSSIEADPRAGKISIEAPVGKLLRNKKAGDKVNLVNGESYVIKKIK